MLNLNEFLSKAEDFEANKEYFSQVEDSLDFIYESELKSFIKILGFVLLKNGIPLRIFGEPSYLSFLLEFENEFINIVYNEEHFRPEINSWLK